MKVSSLEPVDQELFFLSGCPLTCPSCINKEKVHTQGKEVGANEFIELIKTLADKKCLQYSTTITYSSFAKS